MVSTEDITLEAELIEGSEIATLTDSNLNYLVPSGKYRPLPARCGR